MLRWPGHGARHHTHESSVLTTWQRVQKKWVYEDEAEAMRNSYNGALASLVDAAAGLIPSSATGDQVAEFYFKLLERIDIFERHQHENAWAWDRYDGQIDCVHFMCVTAPAI